MSIFLPIAIVGGIGLVAGVGLAIFAAAMYVPVDERTERLLDALPGLNCGACGYSGCAGYAEALVGEGAPAGLCTPGGTDTAAALAGALGVEAGAVAKRRAFVRCGGGESHCKPGHEYRGEPSCAASALFFGGQRQCGYGCLGFGDCVGACPNGAVALRDGVAEVNPALCHGCGICAKACPKKIIVMADARGGAVSRCASHAPGAVCRKQCGAGCLGCGICARACPESAIKVEDNLAVVDAEKCVGCGLCVGKCPKGCLVMQG